ncbi:MAG: prenyltransferase/squalene oxidase repeat-containing protein [Pirellulaceae bacterium]
MSATLANPTPATAQQLQSAYARVRQLLENERTDQGHWTGQLSASALSTATAISAMSLMQQNGGATKQQVDEPIKGGISWLAEHVNEDGGWGDTTKSYTNIATTMLAIAAIRIADREAEYPALIERAEKTVDALGRLDGLRARYGKDKTFAIPILTNCALAKSCPWEAISALPFELACLPQSWYQFARLPVVSYAIPALVAIGQARHFHRPSAWPWVRWLRNAAVEPSLRVLERMQPESGGYLEAVPLTSFVVMSLAAMGRGESEVGKKGLQFILDSRRDDNSWPIDTNLATWNTTLAINACAGAGEQVHDWPCWDWLLKCQFSQRHASTGAAPGGWGWTDLSGAVPDADDTPGALLALRTCFEQLDANDDRQRDLVDAAVAGVTWLLNMQNRDGGWPTFCRGWGKLPFDRSGSDLTAHALRALHVWRQECSAERIDRATRQGQRYLSKQQRPDGSWTPLWFGNQDHPDEENPVYGTSKVLFYYRDSGQIETSVADRGLRYLAQTQNPDGGWGSQTSSVEETSLAVEALLACPGPVATEAASGLSWLVQTVDDGEVSSESPIGFYFAKLWYHERLYPLIFATSALGRAIRKAELGPSTWNHPLDAVSEKKSAKQVET